MTEVSYIPDHRHRAHRELLNRYRDKPRIIALIDALVAPIQKLEDSFFELTMWTGIDTSSGDQLDQWGVIINEQRLGLSDTDYRRFIRARALATVCEGTPDQLINIWKLTTGASQVLYFGCPPAGYTLVAFTNIPLSDSLRRRIRNMMVDVKPAGVGHRLIEAPASAFQYDLGPGYDLGALSRIL